MTTNLATCDTTDRLFPVPVVSELTAIPRSTVYALVAAGVLPAVRIPGTGKRCFVRISETALREFLARHATGGAR